jgi:hypothetical protein
VADWGVGGLPGKQLQGASVRPSSVLVLIKCVRAFGPGGLRCCEAQEPTGKFPGIPVGQSATATVYRSQILCVFSFVKSGSLSISAAKGRLEPKVTSPFESSTSVSYE